MIDAEADLAPIEAVELDATVASDESHMNQTQTQPRPNFDSALLDLDESDFSAASIADEVVLDLDFEVPAPARIEAASPQQTIAGEDALPAPIQLDDASVTTPEVTRAEETPSSTSVIESVPEAISATMHQGPAPSTTELLSAQQIDAIARRVMDQMSDQVIREIAWEVVPELSELLIRKKLDEQK